MHKGLDYWLPACAALGGVIIAVIASYFGGFLGILLAGLLIGFAAVRYDLDKQDVGGGFPSPSLYARQVAVREQMTAEERFANRASHEFRWVRAIGKGGRQRLLDQREPAAAMREQQLDAVTPHVDSGPRPGTDASSHVMEVS